MARRNVFPLTVLVIAGLVTACSGGAASPSATATPAPAATQGSVATQGVTATQGVAATQGAAAATPAQDAASAIHLNLVADGTEARYRVREQLAELSFPSDAIGKTSAVTGSVVINGDGSIVPNLSKWVVDVTTLVSDKGQRDRFVQRNLLETSQYPTAEFDITGASGLAAPLPTAGPVNFQISGNLTAHGVTKPATWAVTGQILSSTEMTGTATTSFKFEDYGIQQPSVPVVLSVVDKITLEIDFHLRKGS
jgi:polyisoprenoid-binding protein YceI